jgi:hypothetical protein
MTIMPALVHAVFENMLGNPPDPTWGLAAIGSRLTKQGLCLPALKEQFSLIKKFRNKAVHGGLAFPTDQQTEAIVLLTRVSSPDRIPRGGWDGKREAKHEDWGLNGSDHLLYPARSLMTNISTIRWHL